MHGKEVAIAPTFADRLGLTIEVAPNLDTDVFGTFTGETPRAGTIRETAVAKARLGMAATGLSIGIASEGSYGPNPFIPFVPGGVEMMVLVDDESGIVVDEHLIDHAPVHQHQVTRDIGEMSAFLERIRFPEHAVIVRANVAPNGDAPIFKGVRTLSLLAAAIADSAAGSQDGFALVQTDMRAHMNPTRMAAIARLAASLCTRIATSCPACGSPGYGQVDVEAGLPCRRCGAASELVKYEIFGCISCRRHERRALSDGRTHADPRQCSKCNP